MTEGDWPWAMIYGRDALLSWAPSFLGDYISDDLASAVAMAIEPNVTGPWVAGLWFLVSGDKDDIFCALLSLCDPWGLFLTFASSFIDSRLWLASVLLPEFLCISLALSLETYTSLSLSLFLLLILFILAKSASLLLISYWFLPFRFWTNKLGIRTCCD